MAQSDRIAALDEALENGGDLWQFGTMTLKGFANQRFDDDELAEFESMLDPDDPLLRDSLPPSSSDLAAAVDAALADDEFSEIGTRTLRALAHEAFDLEMERAMQAPCMKMEHSSAPAAAPLKAAAGASARVDVPDSSKLITAAKENKEPPQSFGANTLRGFAAGAPPAGFPVRNDHPQQQQKAPCATPGQGPLYGLSSRAHQVLPPQAAKKPTEWKISSDMMNQKWGAVLRTLQPGAINTGNMSGRGGGGL